MRPDEHTIIARRVMEADIDFLAPGVNRAMDNLSEWLKMHHELAQEGALKDDEAVIHNVVAHRILKALIEVFGPDDTEIFRDVGLTVSGLVAAAAAVNYMRFSAEDAVTTAEAIAREAAMWGDTDV